MQMLCWGSIMGGVEAGVDTSGRWMWLTGSVRAAWADEPSPLELLIGREQAQEARLKAESQWVLVVGATALVCLLLITEDIEGLRWGPSVLLCSIGVALAGTVSLLSDRLPSDAATWLAWAGVPCIVLGAAFVGPHFELLVAAGLGAIVLAYIFFRRRVASIASVELLVAYGVLLASQPGYPQPVARWFVFASLVISTCSVVVWAVGLIQRLALQERAAQVDLTLAHAEMAELNDQLAEVVDQQDTEIGSLMQLRHFLSPQVAEAVLKEGMAALAPHRARIAVVFCDLRGFTSFSSSAEPEEVMEVLDRYYATVGRALHDRGATVGTFAGDGIMAYFGDPVPCEDPAGTAVEMAVALRLAMVNVVDHWRRRGFDLGCGMGIAYGYATIGPVGFAERTDYTALGPTVNLASRLCSRAADGEILIDGRSREVVDRRVTVEERVLELRGFPLPVTAHSVTSWTADQQPISGL